MKKVIRKIPWKYIGVAALIMLAGCSIGADDAPDVSEETPEPKPGEKIGSYGDVEMYKYQDNESGVTCYVLLEDRNQISCASTNSSGV